MTGGVLTHLDLWGSVPLWGGQSVALVGLSLDDLCWGVGWTIGLMGVAVAVWLVFGESIKRLVGRRRRMARCPGGWRRVVVLPVRDGCWYELAGVTAAVDGAIVCPECGRRVTARRQRTARHRWGRGLLVLPVVIVGYGMWTTPRVRSHGWPGAIPTTALIAAMPTLHGLLPPHAQWAMADPRQVKIYEELARRLRGPRMWRWQRSLAVELAPVGDKAFERAAFGAWMNRIPPGMDLKMCDPCLLALWDGMGSARQTRGQTGRLLSRVLAEQDEIREGLTHARDAWWDRTPVLIDFRQLRFFLPGSAGPAVIRARVKGSGQPWEEHCGWIGDLSHPLCEPERWLRAPAGMTEREIEVEIRLGARSLGPHPDWITSIDRSEEWLAWAGVVRAVRVEARPEASLTPVDEPRDERRLSEWLKRVRVTELDDGTPAVVWPSPHEHFTTTGIDCVFAATFELVHEGRVLARGTTIRWLPEPGSMIMSNSLGAMADRAERVDGVPAELPQTGLTVRFFGDARLAWRSLPYDAYWAGDIEVPVRFMARGSMRLFVSEPSFPERQPAGNEDALAGPDRADAATGR